VLNDWARLFWGIWHLTRVRAAASCLAGVAGLLFAAEVAAASRAANPPPPPVFAQSVDAGSVKGMVFATTPGGSRTSLTTQRQVPVGTAFDVRRGTVRITAADGSGGTYTGTFGKGRFEILQSDSGGGAAEIKLIGKACVKPAAARALAAAGRTRASAARRPRHHASIFRQLQVNAGGNFVVVGVAASAVASGQATYSLVDACDGTRIVDESGRVVAQHKQAAPKKLRPGQSDTDYCHPARNPVFCQFLIQSPRSSVFTFGLALTQPRASSFRVCYRTPAGKSKCFAGPLSNGSLQGGVLACLVNDGPGTYPVRYFVDGGQIGIRLLFKATRPRQVFLGQDSCRSFQG
jgi:hypothetical protein